MAQVPCYIVGNGEELDYDFAADAVSGDVVVVGSIPGIVKRDVDFSENARGVIDLTHLWDVPQKAEIIAAGDAVYWDATGDPYGGTAGSGAATGTASGNYLMGVAAPIQRNGTTDTTATDTHVRVKLTAASRTATEAGSTTATDITGSDSTLAIAGLAAAQGGLVSVTGGTSATSGNAGGAVSNLGGTGGATGAGGAANLTGGTSGATSGTGGATTVAGGAAGSAAGNAAGGAVTVVGGLGKGTGAGGALAITGGGGGSGATGNGGAIAGAGGAANSTNGTGGAVGWTGGAGTGTGAGGAVSLAGGAAAGSGDGGAVIVTTGTSGSGVAGNIHLRAKVLGYQDSTPETATDSASLSDAQMLAGILVGTPTAAAAYTVRTGTQLEAALGGTLADGDSFDLTVINLGGAGDIITMTAAAGITFVGAEEIDDPGTDVTSSGTFRFVRGAANTFVAYRIG